MRNLARRRYWDNGAEVGGRVHGGVLRHPRAAPRPDRRELREASHGDEAARLPPVRRLGGRRDRGRRRRRGAHELLLRTPRLRMRTRDDGGLEIRRLRGGTYGLRRSARDEGCEKAAFACGREREGAAALILLGSEQQARKMWAWPCSALATSEGPNLTGLDLTRSSSRSDTDLRKETS